VPRDPGVVAALRRDGSLAATTVDGVTYLWPTEHGAEGPAAPSDDVDRVRFLAPFDPVVWDRRRFEHLWGWPYRFEAYTPAVKRQWGYYALPLLWREAVIGWVNASARRGDVVVEAGFVASRPRAKAFRIAFDDEVEQLRAFLTGAPGS
jgi:uncharacterized protein YcaQ